MKLLILFPVGADRNGRPIFETLKGHYVVDVDYQKNPRTDILTKYPATDGYYGEPDCHLSDELTPIFMDDVVETINEALEINNWPLRYHLKENRVFACHNPEHGACFEELTPALIEKLAETARPVVLEGYPVDTIAF